MKTKSEDRKKHILKIADEVFREMGFDAASMSIISARIGGSKATLYNYFSSKDELFAEVMLNAAHDLRGDALAVLDLDLELPEKFLRFGVDYLKFKTSDKMLDLRRMAIMHADKAQIGHHVYERGIKKCWGKVAELLEQGMKAKTIRKADPWMAATHLKGLLEADLIDRCYLNVPVDLKTPNLKKHAALALDIFFRAYSL